MSTETQRIATCPVCHGAVGKREDGTLYPHKRWADGMEYKAGQLVQCEGGGPPEAQGEQ